ncbi:reverse transcriptase domain-containing protein [Bacteriovoracales bacterium]|nr:reverse transcriptase domain-containing protein [Bacteriovoracales bacterium]
MPQIQSQVEKGTYTLSPTKRITINRKRTSLWSSEDSLVLKDLALTLEKKLPPHLSKKCTHLKNNGGLKGALRSVLKTKNKFIMRSDVKSYYASINHHILFNQFCDLIPEKNHRRIVWQYLKRTEDINGNYVSIEKGISLGCPLSPLMAALYLKPLDQEMEKLEKEGISYIRYMDDWVITAPTRWKLRKAVKKVNQVLKKLKVEKNPDKTYIGKKETFNSSATL